MSEQQQTQPVATQSSENSPEGEEFHYHHEAERTELEKWLRTGAKRLEPYSNQILAGVIAVTVVAAIAIYWARSTGGSQQESWNSFINAEAPEDYLEVAENFPNGESAAWAKLQAGRLFLNQGLNTALSNRDSSDKSLTQAKEAFAGVLDHPKATKAAKSHAVYGLATTLEVLSGDDLSLAIEQYQRLVESYPESEHVAWAEQRIQELKRDSVVEFYAWFRKQKPSPDDRRLPSDFQIPPGFESSMPDLNLIPPTEDADEEMEESAAPSGVGPENTNEIPEDTVEKPAEEKTPESAPEFPPQSPESEKSKDEAESAEESEASTSDRPEAPSLPAPDADENETATNPE